MHLLINPISQSQTMPNTENSIDSIFSSAAWVRRPVWIYRALT
uniref:Uncharacterized protein n=1 Tax=Rhizophora mucronata TaxID=61149 RepID=A0A2P2N7S4_RHIMU